MKSGIDTCHACDNKLVELYDKWQITKEFEDYDQGIKMLVGDFRDAMSDPLLKKLCAGILKAIENNVATKLGIQFVKSVTQGDGKKIDKKAIYEKEPHCYYCNSKIFVKRVMLVESELYVCGRCCTALHGKIRYLDD